MGDHDDFERVEGTGLDDPELLDGWRTLAEIRGDPFLTPEWFRAWTSETAEPPFLLVWRPAGELRGVLPLVRVRSGPLSVLRFAGASIGDWFGPACRAEDEPAMAAACAGWLSRERGAWHLLQLDRIEGDSAWPQALWGTGTGRVRAARPRRTDVLPFIAFDAGGYEGYLAGRSRNFRSQLGRRRRALESDHEVTFRMTREREHLVPDLETFFALHEERWSDRGGSAALAGGFDKTHRRFAAAALERGWLRLWTVDVDGAPAASWYGWRIGSRYCYALSGLRAEFETRALGTILLAHTIEQAAAEGAAIYDLLRGDDPYKRRFETGRRTAHSWTLGRRRHPVALARNGLDRFAGGARTLPRPVRRPLGSAYRRATGK